MDVHWILSYSLLSHSHCSSGVLHSPLFLPDIFYAFLFCLPFFTLSCCSNCCCRCGVCLRVVTAVVAATNRFYTIRRLRFVCYRRLLFATIHSVSCVATTKRLVNQVSIWLNLVDTWVVCECVCAGLEWRPCIRLSVTTTVTIGITTNVYNSRRRRFPGVTS